MRNLIKLLVATFLLSSCAVQNHHSYNIPTGDPRTANLFYLGVDDIQELGEIEISHEFSRYFFLGTRLIGINGERPDNSNKHYASAPLSVWGNVTEFFSLDGGGMSRALYKVYTEFPDADYINIVSTHEETHRMFLGRKIKRTSRVKAYKFRDPK
jgi:hypothetical protein